MACPAARALYVLQAFRKNVLAKCYGGAHFGSACATLGLASDVVHSLAFVDCMQIMQWVSI